MPVFCSIDDKRVPLYRIVWVSELPHFCGDPECEREGHYEVRLEEGESVWAASAMQQEAAIDSLEAWLLGQQHDDDISEEP